jgi:uncharacterized membrane protein YcaP (DUF421 family)
MDKFHAIIGEGATHLLWWQMCIRAVFIFIFGLLLIRFFATRAFGKQNALDILFTVIMGTTLSLVLTGNAAFIPTLEATALLAIMLWLIERLATRSRTIALLVKGKAVPLIQEGKPDSVGMKGAGVTGEDIEEAARLSGLKMDRLQAAFLERNGAISTISKE